MCVTKIRTCVFNVQFVSSTKGLFSTSTKCVLVQRQKCASPAQNAFVIRYRDKAVRLPCHTVGLEVSLSKYFRGWPNQENLKHEINDNEHLLRLCRQYIFRKWLFLCATSRRKVHFLNRKWPFLNQSHHRQIAEANKEVRKATVVVMAEHHAPIKM